ncbi:MAG: hypothetical protein WDN00_04345 [Limisphaerales bacterium]
MNAALRKRCRPDGGWGIGGVGGYKDFAPDGAAANSNGVASFSPVLDDAGGLRWVNAQDGKQL